jgi:hypothetical protein
MILSLPAHHFFTILKSFSLPSILLVKIEHHLTDFCVSNRNSGSQPQLTFKSIIVEAGTVPTPSFKKIKGKSGQHLDVCFRYSSPISCTNVNRKAIDNCVYGIQILSGEMISRAFISSNIPFENIFSGQYKMDPRI